MQNLARSLGLDERKVGQLFSGRTVVVKSQLSRDEALALQEQFAALGAVARIKDRKPVSEPAFKVDQRVTDHTLRDITAAHQECPRCGHLQLESQFCARCGVDIVTHTRQSRKEDVLIAKKIREMQIKKQAQAQVETQAQTEEATRITSTVVEAGQTVKESPKTPGILGKLARKLSLK